MLPAIYVGRCEHDADGSNDCLARHDGPGNRGRGLRPARPHGCRRRRRHGLRPRHEWQWDVRLARGRGAGRAPPSRDLGHLGRPVEPQPAAERIVRLWGAPPVGILAPGTPPIPSAYPIAYGYERYFFTDGTQTVPMAVAGT